MMTWITILAGILLYSLQIFICFRTRVTHLRAIPAMLLTALLALCVFFYILGSDVFTSALAVIMTAVTLAILLVVDAAAWLTYCIIRFIQKVR